MAADGVVPDVRDGLTPGCRRALWALGMARARGVDHRSSAEILDAVLAWPRSGGRRAIYRELVRTLECALPLKIVGCVGGAARTISLREVIGHYLDHRRAVLARHTGVRSESRLLEIVRDDLRDVAERFGDERRTEIG